MVRNNRRLDPVMIWTPRGCWYQDRVDGRTFVCELGYIGLQMDVERWCSQHGIVFEVLFGRLIYEHKKAA
jgi:hypothetical protein